MEFELITIDKANKSEWSGGETIQYYIYPQTSSYKNRNFNFRLSMAKANIDFSTYTYLPGVTRYLVSLENTAIIDHKLHHSIKLEPFCSVDCFSGDWETTAKGAIRDFNLMLANGAIGEMLVETNRRIILDDKYTYVALYFEYASEVVISGYSKIIECSAHSVLLINKPLLNTELIVKSTSEAIIRCNIIV